VIHLIEFIQQNAMLQRGERAASVNRAPPCTPQLMSYLERRRPELMLVRFLQMDSVQDGHYKTMILAVEQDAMAIEAA